MSTTAGRNDFHKFICSSCAQPGRMYTSKVISACLPGFDLCVCPNCDGPAVWVICSICPGTKLQFKMGHSADGSHLRFLNFEQMRNHVKTSSGKHSNVPRPIAKTISASVLQEIFPQNKRGPNNSQTQPPCLSPPPVNKKPRCAEMAGTCQQDPDAGVFKAWPCQQLCRDPQICMEKNTFQKDQDQLPPLFGIEDEIEETMEQLSLDFPGLTVTRSVLEDLAETGQLDFFRLYIHSQAGSIQNRSRAGDQQGHALTSTAAAGNHRRGGAGDQQGPVPPATTDYRRQPLKYLPPVSIEHLPHLSQFGRLATKEFIFYASQGWGVEFLARKANFGKHWSEKHITDDELVRFIDIVKFVWSVKRRQEHDLAKILKWPIPSSLQCICEQKDLRRIVYDGPNSFMKNLPYPDPVEISHPDGKPFGSYAYVPIIESLALLCLFGFDNFDFIAPGSEDISVWAMRLSESNYAQEMYDPDADVHLLLVSWQDGYAPNRVKKERNKTWLKTATLTTIKKDGPFCSKWKTTLLVAVGREKDDKRYVERRFYEDIAKLNQKGGLEFYNLPLNKSVKVRVSLVAILGDQPERRDLCGFAKVAQHLYGKALGVAGLWKAIYRSVPSCDACLKALLQNKTVVKNCQRCLNWDVLRNSQLATYKKLDKLPTVDGEEEAMIGRFTEIDYPDLIQAAGAAHDHVFYGHWTETAAAEYLKSFGWNTEHAAGIVRNARNMRAWANRATAIADPDAMEVLLEYKRERPSHFERYLLPPALTSGLSMKQVIPVLMHMLFLGFVKSTLQSIGIWLIKERMNATFNAFSEGLLEAVAELRVDWCKPQPFSKNKVGGGLGGTGWMAEDFLSFSRIMMWLYQRLDTLGVTEPEVIPPYDMGNLNCWTLTQCKRWLVLRNLSGKGKEKVVKERVRFYHSKNGGPPQIVPNKPTPHHTQMLVQSLVAMVSRLMARSVDSDSVDDIHCHNLIFLSFNQRWDMDLSVGLGQGSKCPSWLRSPNLLDLARLADYYRRFGPLVQFWEGGWRAEKMITVMRSLTSRGDRKDWSMHAARNFQKANSLDFVRSLVHPPNQFGVSSKHRYHPYKQAADVVAAFNSRKPFSGFLMSNGEYGVCVLQKRKNNCTAQKCVVVRHVESKSTRCSLAYHKWELADEESSAGLVQKDIVRCLLFLPVLCDDGFSSGEESLGVYTVIAEDWMILDDKLEFARPVVESWWGEGADEGQGNNEMLGNDDDQSIDDGSRASDGESDDEGSQADEENSL